MPSAARPPGRIRHGAAEMSTLFTSTGWIILGFVLLGAEMMLPGVYLLFLGVGALAIGLNLLFLPGLSIASQLVGFALVSAAAAAVGYRWYGNRTAPSDSVVNSRRQQLIGRKAMVSEAIVNGRGRVRLDDGWWSVAGPDLPIGTSVRITEASGALLTVAPDEPVE
jgi:inner membrane protein